MVDDPFADRRRLTFEQAEGAAPMPTQLLLKQLSSPLRASLWYVFHTFIAGDMKASGNTYSLGVKWSAILRDRWVLVEHQMIHQFPESAEEHFEKLIYIFQNGTILRY